MSFEHVPKPRPPHKQEKLTKESISRLGILISRAAAVPQEIEAIHDVLTERFGSAVRPYRRNDQWPYFVQVVRRDETAKLVLAHGGFFGAEERRDTYAAALSEVAIARAEPVTVRASRMRALVHHGQYSEGRVELDLAHASVLHQDRALSIAAFNAATGVNSTWNNVNARLSIADIMDPDVADEIRQNTIEFTLTLDSLAVITRRQRQT